jgi:hypothetical protein
MAYTTIDKPTDYFETVLYAGNDTAIGSGGQTITGVGFQPDWVWVKRRNVDTAHHAIYDSVRGATKQLSSSQTDAETTQSEGLTAFGSDGFTVGNLGRVNEAGGRNYASWNWLAGGTASSNTDGSITSSVSANTTAGFSIVSYTSNGSASQTVGHGLGVPPNVIISKNRTDGGTTYGNWVVYHSSLATANDKKTLLNSNSASSTTNEWGDTDPTSSVYSVHTSGDGATNHSTDNIIAYCFAEKKGYSKFGSYTGNGTNNNGTFFYCGFSASVVIIKASSSSRNWVILDNKRLGYNDKNYRLFPNLTNAEDTTSGIIDFTANGFKLMSNNNTVNESGVTYIVMAFAESPFVNSNGVPTTQDRS